MQLKGFIGPTYTLQSTAIEAQRTINLFPQIDESGAGKNVASLLWTPGLKLLCNLGTLPARGAIATTAGRLFIVAGATLYEIFSDGSKTNRGTLVTPAGRVGIAENGQQLLIVDGTNGYSYDLTANTLSAPLANFPGGSTVCFQDSYFIFNQPNTQKFYITGQYDVTVDPLDFASAEGSPDNLLNVISSHEELWLFGSQSIEVWYNSGAELFPFQAVAGSFIPHGTAAQFSPIEADNTLAWLGQDETGGGIFWKASGYTPVRISTHAIEQAIRKYPRIDDCTGYAYQQDGHTFGVWNFPSGNATWVYDFATNLWHERAYTGSLGLERHRGELHAYAFGKHIVTDYANGNVYILDPTRLNDNGRPITKQRAAPYIQDELKNLFISKVQLDMQMGLGQQVDVLKGPGAVADLAVTEVYVNAFGSDSVQYSRPLGNTNYWSMWSNFSLISSLPPDAVIQGIYPVMVAQDSGVGGVGWYISGTSINLGAPGASSPLNRTPVTPPFPTTTLWGNSIGTTLSTLTGQEIVSMINATLSEDNDTRLITVTAVGFAIDYTSATPIIDPQMPAPYAVPGGHGIGWALPLSSSQLGNQFGGAPPPIFGQGTGSGYATPAVGTIVGHAWSNPNYILQNDGNAATITLTSGVSDALDITQFDFNVPATMTVNGVQFNLRGHASVSGTQVWAQLLVNGTPTGNVKIATLPTSDGIITFGSLSDLWGATLSYSDVDNELFGVRIIVHPTTYPVTVSLDFAQIELGVSGTVPEPQCMMQWSDDGGVTWSNEYWVGLGKIGERMKRAIWRRLGKTRQRVFRWTMTDDAQIALVNASVDLQEGNS